MDFDDAHLSFSDEDSELFLHSVEISTSDEQDIVSSLGRNIESPKNGSQESNILPVRRHSKYDQISLVKVQDQVVSTKILSTLDNNVRSTANTLQKSGALQSILCPHIKDRDLVKSSMHTTRTVPNILRNNICKENSNSSMTLEIDRCLTDVDVMCNASNVFEEKIERNFAKKGVHKRKQVYSFSSIRQESPDWPDIFKQEYKEPPNIIQKQSRKVKPTKPTSVNGVEVDSKKEREQMNCFLPLPDNEPLNSVEDTDLFGNYMFAQDSCGNNLTDLFDFSIDTVVDNTHTEFYNTDYLNYSDDFIVGSDKLESLLNCTIDSCEQSDTCDINANDIDTSQTISCTSDQCDECESNTLNNTSLSLVGAYDEFVENCQLNDTCTSEWYYQSEADKYVTLNINDVQNECIIDSQSSESYRIDEIICDKSSSTLLELTNIEQTKEERTHAEEHQVEQKLCNENSNTLLELTDTEGTIEICNYTEEHQLEEICIRQTENNDNTNYRENYDRTNLSIIGQTHLQEVEEVPEDSISSRTIIIHNNSKNVKNVISRKRRSSTGNERKIQNAEKLQCLLCPLSFRTQRAMAIHRAGAHGGLYVILCEHCGRLFNNKYHLNRHIVNCRFVQRPFKCDRCDRSYRHKSSLVQHLKNIHEVAYTCNKAKQYICAKCSKVYSKYGAFEKHVSRHDQIE